MSSWGRSVTKVRRAVSMKRMRVTHSAAPPSPTPATSPMYMDPGSITNPTKSAARTTLRENASSYLRSPGISTGAGGVTGFDSDTGALQPFRAALRILAAPVLAQHPPDQEPLAQRREKPAVLPEPGPGFARVAVELDADPVEPLHLHGEGLHSDPLADAEVVGRQPAGHPDRHALLRARHLHGIGGERPDGRVPVRLEEIREVREQSDQVGVADGERKVELEPVTRGRRQ